MLKLLVCQRVNRQLVDSATAPLDRASTGLAIAAGTVCSARWLGAQENTSIRHGSAYDAGLAGQNRYGVTGEAVENIPEPEPEVRVVVHAATSSTALDCT
jgi:hypothetical protein